MRFFLLAVLAVVAATLLLAIVSANPDLKQVRCPGYSGFADGVSNVVVIQYPKNSESLSWNPSGSTPYSETLDPNLWHAFVRYISAGGDFNNRQPQGATATITVGLSATFKTQFSGLTAGSQPSDLVVSRQNSGTDRAGVSGSDIIGFVKASGVSGSVTFSASFSGTVYGPPGTQYHEWVHFSLSIYCFNEYGVRMVVSG